MLDVRLQQRRQSDREGHRAPTWNDFAQRLQGPGPRVQAAASMLSTRWTDPTSMTRPDLL